MKFSYNTIQKYFKEKLPEAEKLAEIIGLHSFELEGIEKVETASGYKDILIDWDILPNRSSDCLSYMGIIKEISAVLDIDYIDFQDEYKEHKFSNNFKTSDFLSLKVEDNKLVKRATKRIAKNVKIDASPKWLVDFLEVNGQKSINNVVDITNYVMLITGQPVHAFDFSKISGEGVKNIFIKKAEKKQKVKDLTSQEHILDESMLIIADNEKALDIAGIKGGEVSGVDENTHTLILSAVNFDFKNIRETSRKIKLQTDASKRFENQVPIEKTKIAMNFMSYLLEKYAGTDISEEILDTNKKIEEKRKIEFTFEKINSILGLKLEDNKIKEILKRLEIEVITVENKFFAEVPQERLDLNIYQDITEEVGRIYGLENIPEKEAVEYFSIPKENILKDTIYKISDILSENGFFEVYNRTLTNTGVVELKNPLTSETNKLRSSLLPLLEKKGERNLVYSEEVKFFEIGKIFLDLKSKDQDKVVDEIFSFAGVITKKKIKEKQKENIFLETKGILEKIFENIDIKNINWQESTDEKFIAILEKDNIVFGEVGVNFWQINLEKLIKLIDKKIEYKEVSKFPSIKRDISFFVPIEYKVKDAERLILSVLPKEAVDLELFDIYKINEENKKSFAFNITFQSENKTLEDNYVNELMKPVYNLLENNNFEIR